MATEVSKPFAHSATEKCDAQTYQSHILGVVQLAELFAKNAAKYLREGRDEFINIIKASAFFHDLGKLDEQNQQVLKTTSKVALPINHVDAGVARLKQLQRLESALLAYSHHRGLPSLIRELLKEDSVFRDKEIEDYIDSKIDHYVCQHSQELSSDIPPLNTPSQLRAGLFSRIALSCLVDADYSDTSAHYGEDSLFSAQPLLPLERLERLDRYVSHLFFNSNDGWRNEVRARIYKSCREAPVDHLICCCDSPVGTGKTTAVMAHLLRAAHEKKLRRIFVILPYTSIIIQSVQRYRDAIVLPEEQPENIIAEHHHQADFSDPNCRALSTLWRAPVVVTTAVQFFETLGSNHPSRLRKLHEVPGSAIFIDESHAAMPSTLWPQMWIWLQQMASNWGCHIVLASGTLTKFWELDRLITPPVNLPNEEVSKVAFENEEKRVNYYSEKKLLSKEELRKFVLSKPGPRIVVLNTVQSASILAAELREQGEEVFHLSTALAPIDRREILRMIGVRLNQQRDRPNWTLVATSCVEAGMDFSFRTGFRQRCGLVNLIQLGGRTNRNGEHQYAEIWDFRVSDPLFNELPDITASQIVLSELLEENQVHLHACTEAMRREIVRDPKRRNDTLKLKEQRMDYPEVARLCRLIDSDTCTVIVKRDIVEALKHGYHLVPREIMINSVQIWSNKIDKLGLQTIAGYGELYWWPYDYDPTFLGYMEGLLPLIYAEQTKAIVI
jgi:CRISPR-associated endonuclease/helicase Cas3